MLGGEGGVKERKNSLGDDESITFKLVMSLVVCYKGRYQAKRRSTVRRTVRRTDGPPGAFCVWLSLLNVAIYGKIKNKIQKRERWGEARGPCTSNVIQKRQGALNIFVLKTQTYINIRRSQTAELLLHKLPC